MGDRRSVGESEVALEGALPRDSHSQSTKTPGELAAPMCMVARFLSPWPPSQDLNVEEPDIRAEGRGQVWQKQGRFHELSLLATGA